MFCEHCGAQNKENSAFCKKCGKPLTATHDITNDMQNSLVYNQRQIDQIKQKNKKLIIAFIIVFVVFIVTTEIICIFTQGLMNNILITLASCVLPVAVGIGFNSLGNAFRNHNGMQRFLHIFGGVFHCLCPVILMFMFFRTFYLSRTTTVVLAFSLAFLGYIPAHYNKNYSLMKNNILGIINLFSIMFMWSFISYYIGVVDALAYAERGAQAEYIVVLLFKVGSILILLQALKLIAEEFEYNTCKEKD